MTTHMVSGVLKFIGKFLFWSIVVIALFIGVNFLWPKVSWEKLTIGQNVGNSFFEYRFSTWEDHLTYMQTFETPYGTLRYLDRGKRDGQPILLIHGIPGSSRERRHITARLVDRGYRVIVPDLLGYGVSKSTDTTMAHQIERQGVVINSLMHYLSIPSRTEVAHDRGSLVTWNQFKDITLHSGDNTQTISHVILISALGYTDGYEASPLVSTHPLLTQIYAYLMSLPLGGQQLATLLLSYDIPTIHAMGDPMIHGYSAPLQLGGWKNYSYAMSHIENYLSLLDIYGTMYTQRNLAVSIIRGSSDLTVDSRHQIPFYKKDFTIPDEDLFVIPGGHYLQEETPGKLAQLIDEIIKNHAPIKVIN